MHYAPKVFNCFSFYFMAVKRTGVLVLQFVQEDKCLETTTTKIQTVSNVFILKVKMSRKLWDGPRMKPLKLQAFRELL